MKRTSPARQKKYLALDTKNIAAHEGKTKIEYLLG
jgi:hypothetical protein